MLTDRMTVAGLLTALASLCCCVGAQANQLPQRDREAEAASLASLIRKDGSGKWSVRELSVGDPVERAEIALGPGWACGREDIAFVCRDAGAVILLGHHEGRVTSIWIAFSSGAVERHAVCSDLRAMIDELTLKFGEPWSRRGAACDADVPQGLASAGAMWKDDSPTTLVVAMSNSPDTLNSFDLGIRIERR